MKSYVKYLNTKVLKDGITFDSKKELRRYEELLLLQKAGKIEALQLQPHFELQEAFTDTLGIKHRAIIYIGDFLYIEKNTHIVEDVKGMLTEIYKIKKKLFLYKYRDFELREV